MPDKPTVRLTNDQFELLRYRIRCALEDMPLSEVGLVDLMEVRIVLEERVDKLGEMCDRHPENQAVPK